MGRTLLKALIRRKSDELQETASQKPGQGDAIQHFEDNPDRHGVGVVNSKDRNSTRPSAHTLDVDQVFPTQKFINAIIRDIKTSKPRESRDNKFRIYELKRLFAKTILAHLKSDTIKEIIKFKHCLNTINPLRFLDGAILVFNKQVIFRLNFEAQAMYSIIINRKGDALKFCILPKRLIDDSEQRRPMQKFLDPRKIRKFVSRFLKNLHTALDFNVEKDTLLNIFGIHPHGKGTFIDGRMIRNKNEIYFEVAVISKFRFPLIMDLNGNFIDITAMECESDTMGLIEKAIHQNNLNPKVNLFYSNIDCLL